MTGYKQKLSLGTLCWDHGVAVHEIGETRYDHDLARILRGGVRTSLEVVLHLSEKSCIPIEN